eukprot:10883407-Lingulodinium_polyedra.AAC.1
MGSRRLLRQGLAQNVPHTAVCCHEWFAYLHDHWPETFARCFLGPGATVENAAAALKHFWRQVPETDARK